MNCHQRKEARSLLWWNIKVLCGLLLIIGLFAQYMTDWLHASLRVPRILPTALVLLGGIIFLYHYYLIKKQNRTLDEAQVLVTTGGLFALIRHPMYLGDILMFTGFALLAPTVPMLCVLAVSIFALAKQAIAEDRYLSALHSTEHERWARSTRILIPAIF